MSRKRWVIAALVLAALVGLGVLYDVLVVSDEERLELLVADSTGRFTSARMDAARRRWVDLRLQPFEISAYGESLLYREGEDEALDARARQAVQTLSGEDLRALTSGVTVEGESARVTIRLMGQRQGMALVEWTLHKHGEQWLVARLSIRR